ncbi:hypothetical protein sscle_14g101990 [Sclerotinia sclerotiorum 1980 UF-70]|uniref:Uncharacterized protein n=1 Tax=Sclerotinia sclerotiorum (strain ATCC 18683 / 1980 / Ss-1) TaxID=665079 RepID=A0A1D9QKN7_SCLS1|nr:hypothetical protein sscle_14g101990 [Sclerotinia sclerotiorum 1980 UF-70]
MNAKILLLTAVVLTPCITATDNGEKMPTRFQSFADGYSPSAPFLAHVQSMVAFHSTKGSFASQGPIHVYVNVGASAQSVFLEGVVYNDAYHAVQLTASGSQNRPEIKPGEVLIEGNTEIFWPQGTAYTRRDTLQFGCNENGKECVTEGFRYNSGYGDIYNLNEATFQPKDNGHPHAGGAHMDHSLVDGYTYLMVIVPDSEECLPYGCTEDPAGGWCPDSHKVLIGRDPTYTGCASDCRVMKTDAACCRGAYNHDECRASSQHFSDRCKNSYAYAYDDRKGLRFCGKVPQITYHFFNLNLDCDWAVMDPQTGNLSRDSRECLNRLIQAP